MIEIFYKIVNVHYFRKKNSIANVGQGPKYASGIYTNFRKFRLFKDTIKPYYWLLKNTKFSIKKSND